MDLPPDNFNFSGRMNEYDQFAVDLYDQADKFFAKVKADSYYEKINDRYMSVDLSEDDLDDIEPILTKYMIDPADAVDIVILGGKPNEVDSTMRGAVWINIRHNNLVSSYAVWLNPALSKPVNATKDLFRITNQNLAKGEPYDGDEALEPGEYVFVGSTIGPDEQNALKEIIKLLVGDEQEDTA